MRSFPLSEYLELREPQVHCHKVRGNATGPNWLPDRANSGRRMLPLDGVRSRTSGIIPSPLNGTGSSPRCGPAPRIAKQGFRRERPVVSHSVMAYEEYRFHWIASGVTAILAR